MIFASILVPIDGGDLTETAAARGLEAQLYATVHVLSVADSGLATSATYVGESE
jgi:hypothetical protein